MANAIPVHSTPAKGKKAKDESKSNGVPVQPEGISQGESQVTGSRTEGQVPVSGGEPESQARGETPVEVVRGQPIKLDSHDAIRVDH